MMFMGKLARRPDDDPVRTTIFDSGGTTLRDLPGKRRVGRPRIRWAHVVMEACLQTAGSKDALNKFFARGNCNEQAWRLHLSAHF